MTFGVTVASRYAEALMLRARKRNLSIVVVEGSSDSRLFRKVLDGTNSHILWLNGKDEAVALTGRFQATKIPGTVALIDADFHRLHGRAKQNALVVWTSENDMETMVIRSEAYMRCAPTTEDPREVRSRREKLLRAVTPLGCLRAISDQKSWKIDFKNLDFEAFIDRVAINCDTQAACEEVLRKNPQCGQDVPSMEEEITYLRAAWATTLSSTTATTSAVSCTYAE